MKDVKTCYIREQTIKDPSGLVIQFEVRPGYHLGTMVNLSFLRISGESLKHGIRELVFAPDGTEIGASRPPNELHRPDWPAQADA